MFFLCMLSACVKRADVNVTDTEETAEDPLFIQAEVLASSLDDRLLTAQIFICGIDGRGKLMPHMKDLLAESPAGAVLLFKYNLNTDNDSIRALIAETASLILDESGLPPFTAVDHEGGTVNRFLPGVATLPDASSYWELLLAEGKDVALAKIEADSNRAGREIFDLGINVNFAPVAEYLNDDNRVFLESRSYGWDPVFSGSAAAAFVRGMENAGVLCVIKHFPGIAGADPHYSPSVLNGDRAALDELVSPFALVFNSGARAVMVAHTAVPALDSEIASLSAVVMKDWLRRDLGFDGVIICDDFIMASAGNQSAESTAIRSVSAGADMVLVWPQDLRRTHQAFLSALEDGRLSRERLIDAAQRIIYEKLRMGLIK